MPYIVARIVLFFGVFGFFAKSAFELRSRANLLSLSGSVTQGEILDILKNKGTRTVTYSFTVGGEQFESTAPSTTFHNLEIGRPIEVHYLPSNPNVSAVDLKGNIETGNRMVLFTSVFVGMTVVFVLIFIIAYRQGNLN
jgi:hypothetical protein